MFVRVVFSSRRACSITFLEFITTLHSMVLYPVSFCSQIDWCFYQVVPIELFVISGMDSSCWFRVPYTSHRQVIAVIRQPCPMVHSGCVSSSYVRYLQPVSRVGGSDSDVSIACVAVSAALGTSSSGLDARWAPLTPVGNDTNRLPRYTH